MDSILNSIKKLLGISDEVDYFDDDIIMCINAAFSTLLQLGAGPADGFSITGTGEEWSEFSTDKKYVEMVKTYIFFKVRLAFDPPSSSVLTESFNRQISELEWRINIAAENYI